MERGHEVKPVAPGWLVSGRIGRCCFVDLVIVSEAMEGPAFMLLHETGSFVSLRMTMVQGPRPESIIAQ